MYTLYAEETYAYYCHHASHKYCATQEQVIQILCLPGCHNNHKNSLFPHHTPEVSVGFWKWPWQIMQQ